MIGELQGHGFTAKTLSIESREGAVSPAFTWSFGQADHGNLFGTVTALDSTTGAVDLNCSNPDAGDHTPNPGMRVGCDFGPISRDGWAVLDDTTRPRLDPDASWLAPPTPPQPWTPGGHSPGGDYTDLYFFGFGHRYSEALEAYTSIAGAPTAPPRFSLGVWWSRYWPYTAEDLEDIAEAYSEHTVPLDVLVSDMAWHYHGEQPIQWGGYTWGKQLFPEPAHFLSTLADTGQEKERCYFSSGYFS